MCDKHNMFHRMDVIYCLTEFLEHEDFKLLMDAWDSKFLQLMLHSETACSKFMMGHIKWSPTIGVWLSRHWLLHWVPSWMLGIGCPDHGNMFQVSRLYQDKYFWPKNFHCWRNLHPDFGNCTENQEIIKESLCSPMSAPFQPHRRCWEEWWFTPCQSNCRNHAPWIPEEIVEVYKSHYPPSLRRQPFIHSGEDTNLRRIIWYRGDYCWQCFWPPVHSILPGVLDTIKFSIILQEIGHLGDTKCAQEIPNGTYNI